MTSGTRNDMGIGVAIWAIFDDRNRKHWVPELARVLLAKKKIRYVYCFPKKSRRIPQPVSRTLASGQRGVSLCVNTSILCYMHNNIEMAPTTHCTLTLRTTATGTAHAGRTPRNRHHPGAQQVNDAARAQCTHSGAAET